MSALGREYLAVRYRNRQAGTNESVPWTLVGAVDGTTLAYDPTPPVGAPSTLKSGEGFVFDFTGPGWVMTQSRNPSALQAWIRQIAPGQTGGAGGALGGLLGN